MDFVGELILESDEYSWFLALGMRGEFVGLADWYQTVMKALLHRYKGENHQWNHPSWDRQENGGKDSGSIWIGWPSKLLSAPLSATFNHGPNQKMNERWDQGFPI